MQQCCIFNIYENSEFFKKKHEYFSIFNSLNTLKLLIIEGVKEGMYMKKWMGLLISIIVLLGGCSEKEETVKKEDDRYKQPPTLFLAVSSVLIEKIDAQNYSWHYTDKTTNKIEKVTTDSLPPSKTVSIKKPLVIKDKKYLKIGFQPLPKYYRIILWDAKDREKATYTNVKDIKKKGTYIMEIEANFEKGEAHYFLPITFPKK